MRRMVRGNVHRSTDTGIRAGRITHCAPCCVVTSELGINSVFPAQTYSALCAKNLTNSFRHKSVFGKNLLGDSVGFTQ